MSQEIRRLARDFRAHVEWMTLSGVDEIPPDTAWPDGLRPSMEEASPATASPALREASGDALRVTTPLSPSADAPLPVDAGADTPSLVAADDLLAADLGGLRAEIGDCQRCRLSGSRKQLVFGSGNPDARLMFVGEAPGRDEDLQGLPFVGRAGELLTDIIQKGMKIDRSEVYICNVVKCRPPENRNPEPEEVSACSPFLSRQIELVGPEVLVALGRFAAQALLGSTTPISRLRGNWHEYRGIPLMPTFHPAHLLRKPDFKRQVWEDIKQVMQRLGIDDR